MPAGQQGDSSHREAPLGTNTLDTRRVSIRAIWSPPDRSPAPLTKSKVRRPETYRSLQLAEPARPAEPQPQPSPASARPAQVRSPQFSARLACDQPVFYKRSSCAEANAASCIVYPIMTSQMNIEYECEQGKKKLSTHRSPPSQLTALGQWAAPASSARLIDQ